MDREKKPIVSSEIEPFLRPSRVIAPQLCGISGLSLRNSRGLECKNTVERSGTDGAPCLLVTAIKPCSSTRIVITPRLRSYGKMTLPVAHGCSRAGRRAARGSPLIIWVASRRSDMAGRKLGGMLDGSIRSTVVKQVEPLTYRLSEDESSRSSA